MRFAGGISPGSMPPFSKLLKQEGAAVVSFKLVKKGVFDTQGVTALLESAGLLKDARDPLMAACEGTRNLSDNLSDLHAQVAANCKGINLLGKLIDQYSLAVVHAYMNFIQQNAEANVREMLKNWLLKL